MWTDTTTGIASTKGNLSTNGDVPPRWNKQTSLRARKESRMGSQAGAKEDKQAIEVGGTEYAQTGNEDL